VANFYGKYTGIFGGGGGGGGGSTTFYQEQPSGTVDGANVTFTLANTPTANANVLLWLDGIVQYQGIGLDYTISGATITMVVAPSAPQTLWAFYS
jgi:hypothetical protein